MRKSKSSRCWYATLLHLCKTEECRLGNWKPLSKPTVQLLPEVFMDAFGFGVYAPFVPVLCQTFSLQVHDMGTALAPRTMLYSERCDIDTGSKSLRMVGYGWLREHVVRCFTKAAFSLAQALNTPFLGYLSDRFGRRPAARLQWAEGWHRHETRKTGL